MANYWSVPNNIISLKKLYFIVKHINENLLNEESIHSSLVEMLNSENLANRAKINTHLRSYAYYYGLIAKNENGFYYTTDAGKELIHNYEENNQNAITQLLAYQMWNIKFPIDHTQIDEDFNIHPFQMLFKLMLDKDIKYVTEFEVSNIISFAKNDNEYNSIKEKILKYRHSNNKDLFPHVGMKQIPKIFNLYTKHFKIFNINQNKYVILPDCIEYIKLLMTEDEREQHEWIKNKKDVDKSFYNEEEYDLRISSAIITRNPKIQSKFRRDLFKYTPNKCAICNISIPYLLTASHIKPVKKIEKVHEAKDYMNGLLLCPIHDALFECGKYISFKDNGSILIKSEIKDILDLLNINEHFTLDSFYLTPQRLFYLNYHRNMFYKKTD